MKKYPDVMKIMREKERLDEIRKNYPIFENAEKIAAIVTIINNPWTTDEEVNKQIEKLRLIMG